MQNNNKVVPMVEGGVLVAVAIIFALISVYIPVIGTFVNLIWPVPIILLGVRHGYKWSIMATVVAGVLIAILMHPLQAVAVVVGFGLIGIALGYAFRNDYSPAKALFIGSCASLVSKLAVVGIGIFIMGINPLNFETEALSSTVTQIVDFYRSMGMGEEDLKKMDESVRTMIDMVKLLFPAGLVLASVADTYLNFWVAKKVLKRLGHAVKPFPPFKLWKMPKYILWFFAAALLMSYLGRTHEQQLVYNIGMNLEVIVSIVLLIQGLALFYFLADKYNLSRLVRGIILVLILTNGLLSQVTVFAGAFDMVFDYRKIRTSE